MVETINKNPVNDAVELTKINELLNNKISIKILDQRPTLLRLDVFPFVIVDIILVIIYYIAVLNDEGYLAIAFPNKYQVMGVMVTFCIIHLFTFLIRMWSVEFDAIIGYRYCGDNDNKDKSEKILKRGTHVLITPPPNKGNKTICTIYNTIITAVDNEETVVEEQFFFHQKQKYTRTSNNKFNKIEMEMFQPINNDKVIQSLNLTSLLSNYNGLSDNKVKPLQKDFGPNKYSVPKRPYLNVLFGQLLSPFFIFQVFCVSLWALDEYWYYSLVTLAMILIFEMTVSIQRYRGFQEMEQMLKDPYKVCVYRNNTWVDISSHHILPGDLIDVKKTFFNNNNNKGNDNLTDNSSNGGNNSNNKTFPCDAVLLNGSVLVNEAMLTGESDYKWKTPCDFTTSSNNATSSNHTLYAGTTITRCPKNNLNNSNSNENGSSVKTDAPKKRNKLLKDRCVAYCIRTGFMTKEGEIMRSIFFHSDTNAEIDFDTIKFLLVLLFFAILASRHVMIHSLNDRYGNRWKLFLHCIVIVTNVIPPELPMQLSLNITTSIASLQRIKIFVSEQWRIPYAGFVTICCFDKTGTLTADEVKVEGTVPLPLPKEQEPPSVVKERKNDVATMIKITKASVETWCICASCHGLANVNGKIVGDSMEKSILRSVGFKLKENGEILAGSKQLANDNNTIKSIKIIRRFNFSSALKRMSCIVKVTLKDNNKTKFLIVTKGAPEIIQTLLSSRDAKTDAIYKTQFETHTKEGKRVLALGYRYMSDNTSRSDCNSLKREDVEQNLNCPGFLVMTSPLKKETKKTLLHLHDAMERIIMITGDNEYTACDVAVRSGLVLSSNPIWLILKMDKTTKKLMWISVNSNDPAQATMKYTDHKMFEKLHNDHSKNYALCISGSALSKLDNNGKIEATKYANVFARVSPIDKERLIIYFKKIGTTLMCGDGTNDVSALKRADVGVSIMNNVTESPTSNNMSRGLKAMQEEINMNNTAQKLSNASLAAPFTSKFSSIHCVIDVVCHGRSTLATTIQMYKILGINCLVSAYSLSALYLHGVKQGDQQATIFALIISFMFFFNSLSKPTKVLDKSKPPKSIFETKQILSVVGQTIINFTSLYYVLNDCKRYTLPYDATMERDGDFEPNILSSGIFLITCTMVLNSFFVNYSGKPHMEPLTKNKFLFYSGLVAYVLYFGASTGFPPLCELFQLVQSEGKDEFWTSMFTIQLFNTAFTFAMQFILNMIF